MAVKKTQLYASLCASCDKLRGGMDSSEYKDYILTLLFMEYVADKFKNKGAYEDIKVFNKAHDKDSVARSGLRSARHSLQNLVRMKMLLQASLLSFAAF